MASPDANNTKFDGFDWQAALSAQAFAHGEPEIHGRIKSIPQDFIVTEVMPVSPSGEGEHVWLSITKERQNTDRVAKALARFASVKYRDVGYSGLKDFQARTKQWFSVWLPGGDTLDWSEFDLPNTVIDRHVRHERKLKRGTHSANQFDLKIRDLDGELSNLEPRLAVIARRGVPNYFGSQRFGNNGDNMRQAFAMLVHGRKIKNRALRSLLISATRSWLFNQCVSQRVSEGSWQTLYEGEPANLHSTNSVFASCSDSATATRLHELDIHPTAPMTGDGAAVIMKACPVLYRKEQAWLQRYQPFSDALIAARVDYQRRALRCVPENLQWQLEGRELYLSFALPKGQFATSVLRELLQTQ